MTEDSGQPPLKRVKLEEEVPSPSAPHPVRIKQEPRDPAEEEAEDNAEEEQELYLQFPSLISFLGLPRRRERPKEPAARFADFVNQLFPTAQQTSVDPDAAAAPTASSSSSSSPASSSLLQVLAAPHEPQPPVLLRALPVYRQRQSLLLAVQEHPVTVVVGPTGSGKSVCVPQLLLDAGLARDGRMNVVVQPNAATAMSLSAKISKMRGQQAENMEIGWQSRYGDHTAEDARLMFCTAIVLLQWLQHDPDLAGIGCLVLDEVQQRETFTEILLGILKGKLEKTQLLGPKLVVLTTPWHADAVTEYLRPVCPGLLRLMLQNPIHTPHEFFREDLAGLPLSPHPSPPDDPLARGSALPAADLQLLHAVIVLVHARAAPGAILVFLPDRPALHRLAATLAADPASATLQVLPLHPLLPPAALAALAASPPAAARRCILATAAAEYTLPADHVRYVIDAAADPDVRWDDARAAWVSRPAVPSRRAALARAARAARGPGGIVCRLSARAAVADAPTAAPLCVQPLDDVLLALHHLPAAAALPPAATFLGSCPSPPPPAAIAGAQARLHAQGLLVAPDGTTTPLGQWLAALPVPFPAGRLLLVAAALGVLAPAAVLAAFLVADFPEPCRVGPVGAAGAAGAHWELLQLFGGWRAAVRHGVGHEYCRRRHLDPDAMASVDGIFAELTELLGGFGYIGPALACDGPFPFGPDSADWTLLKVALCAALRPSLVHLRRTSADTVVALRGAPDADPPSAPAVDDPSPDPAGGPAPEPSPAPEAAARAVPLSSGLVLPPVGGEGQWAVYEACVRHQEGPGAARATAAAAPPVPGQWVEWHSCTPMEEAVVLLVSGTLSLEEGGARIVFDGWAADVPSATQRHCRRLVSARQQLEAHLTQAYQTQSLAAAPSSLLAAVTASAKAHLRLHGLSHRSESRQTFCTEA